MDPCVSSVITSTRCLCRVTRAGHRRPLWPSPTAPPAPSPCRPGISLGFGDPSFTTTGLRLAPGSVLVLYTDGLVEARGSDIDDRPAELTHLVAQPVHSLNALCDSLLTHLVPDCADHDIALLAARLTGSVPAHGSHGYVGSAALRRGRADRCRHGDTRGAI